MSLKACGLLAAAAAAATAAAVAGCAGCARPPAGGDPAGAAAGAAGAGARSAAGVAPAGAADAEADASTDADAIRALVEDVRQGYGEVIERRPSTAWAAGLDAVAEASDRARAHAALQPLAPRLASITTAIHARREPVIVQELAAGLLGELARRAGPPPVPAARPPGRRGAAVYAAACAACHGASGTPDAETRTRLAPTDFRNAGEVNELSPLRVRDAVAHGVHGTAMPAFPTLSEADRWAVAFHVLSLRYPRCAAAPASVPAAELALASNHDLVARVGERAVACLRHP